MSLTDYSSMESDIKDAPEMEALPKNTEAKLRIVKIDSGIIEDEAKPSFGAEWHSITFDVPTEVNCPMFNSFMWDLNSKDKLTLNNFSRPFVTFVTLRMPLTLTTPDLLTGKNFKVLRDGQC